MSSLDTALLSAEQAKAAQAAPQTTSTDAIRVVVIEQQQHTQQVTRRRRRGGSGFCCTFLLVFFIVSFFTWPRSPRADWVESTFTLSLAIPPLSMEHTYSVRNNNYASDTFNDLEVVQYFCASADRDEDQCRIWTPIGGTVTDEGDDTDKTKIKGRKSKLISRTFLFAEVERGTLSDLQQQCYGPSGVLMMQQGVITSKRMGTVPLEQQIHIQACIDTDAEAEE